MMKKKTDTKNDKLFVTDVVSLFKQLKHQEEYNIISNIREKFQHLILVDGINGVREECQKVIDEVTNGQPIKGNIRYFAEYSEENSLNIEIVRNAHGSVMQAKRTNGGVVIATLVIVKIKGEYSRIMGFTWYHPEQFDPFAHLD